MATLNSRTQILSRPQIQTGQPPIPRQVILPPKAVAAPKIPAQAVSIVPPTRPMITPASTNVLSRIQQAMPMSATPPAPVRPVPRVITDPVPPAPPVAFNPNMQSTQAMPNILSIRPNNSFQQPSVAAPIGYTAQTASMFNPSSNTPNINSPLFSGYSAPMPNNMYDPMNYATDVNDPLFAGVGAMPPSSSYTFPNTSNPLFAGYSAPMPSNMYNQPNYVIDVKNPLFAGVGAMPPYVTMGNSANQGPKTEADWNKFASMASFAPNTDMEAAKAQFLAGVGGSVRDPMQQQGGFGGQQQGFGSPQLPYATGAMPPQTMPQTGFTPMGGYNPQNTSYGSFGAIQQPMGGFQNIGSLLGKG